MNNSIRNEMNFYEEASESIQTIEKAILAETVNFSNLVPQKGKFIIPSTTPSMQVDTIDSNSTNGITGSNYVELLIPVHFLFNFMNPQVVPVKDLIEAIKHTPQKCSPTCSVLNHILGSYPYQYMIGFYNNKFSIPKGTEFVVEFIGGKMELDLVNIIGLYKIGSGGSTASGRRK